MDCVVFRYLRKNSATFFVGLYFACRFRELCDCNTEVITHIYHWQSVRLSQIPATALLTKWASF